MFKCQNKFWVENITDLFCSTNIVPIMGNSLEQQMNSVTRLVFIITFILILFNFKHYALFLILSLFFIIILYYIQRNQMAMTRTENYQIETCTSCEKKGNKLSIDKGNIVVKRPSVYRFCDDGVLLDYDDPNFTTPNQFLHGPPNPKTLIAPVIVPQSHRLDYWKANNLVNHSAINSQSQEEAYQSGFVESTCCGNTGTDYLIPQKCNRKSAKKYEINCDKKKKKPKKCCCCDEDEKEKEELEFPYDLSNNFHGTVNKSCGYNPEQLFTSGLPVNYPAGNCEKDPALKEYNENLYTQTIEPGIYYRNQVNEPINSNIGISFTQQFNPTTCNTDEDGNVLFTEHDPLLFSEDMIEPIVEGVDISNVYDPRHSGYGTSYRSYNFDKLGQTRFMYDDVNAIRMPNYISRSNIDNQPFADHYGPLPRNGAMGNEFHSKIRSLANDAFSRSTIEFRTGLQESLMRKRNSEMWQLRKAPINTHSQYMGGGIWL